MSQIKNILFIMCDQLRWDYLSCYGHPHLQTPNIDRLAAQGMRFEHAYVQSPLCGPSRRCTLTGRYMFSLGSQTNPDPLRVGEMFLGDYLCPLGIRTALVGKTHMRADREGLIRLGIQPNSPAAQREIEAGFEAFERDDGLHPDPIARPNLPYNQYLRARGYDPVNPWDRNANGALDKEGNFVSGWYLRNAGRPANIREEDSETPYMTRRAMEFIEEAGEQPWCLHLSYIKPHWPYLAPAPYHNLYNKEQILPVVRSEAERAAAHPVYDAFMQLRYSQSFSQDEVRETVIPAYMGLIKQIDDQMGHLLDFLEQRGRMQDTMIVFTSDHGDYLGDHWLGEKDLFHEPSVRIPLIIYDPSPAADGTRGTVEKRLVESIDLVPTFLDAVGGKAQPHRLEGCSLLPLLHGETGVAWRDYVISEIDYSDRDAMNLLDLAPALCRAFMLRTERWKYILHETFCPQLYDLQNDPNEFIDLGDDPAYQAVRAELHEKLFTWLRRRRLRVTVPLEHLRDRSVAEQEASLGILIGYW